MLARLPLRKVHGCEARGKATKHGILMLVCCCGLCIVAVAEVHVGSGVATPDGTASNPWPSVEDAILNLPAGETTITILPGRYEGTTTIDAMSGVLFRAATPGSVILDGAWNNGLINITSSSVQFEGIRFEKAFGSAAVAVWNSSVSFTDCAWRHNSLATNVVASTAGAVSIAPLDVSTAPIHQTLNDAKLQNCTFENNTGLSHAGALTMLQGTLDISACRFSGNSGVSGAAVHLDAKYGGKLVATIRDSVFHTNAAYEHRLDRFALGGAAFVGTANSSWYNVQFQNNIATGRYGSIGGAIALRASAPSETVFQQCSMLMNKALYGGGCGMEGNYSIARIFGGKVSANEAADEKLVDVLSSLGGNIYISKGSQLDVFDTEISSGRATFGGSVTATGYAALSLSSCLILNSTAHKGGGGLQVTDGASLLMDKTNVTSNSANHGASINTNKGILNITRSNFEANSVLEAGGSLYIRNCRNATFFACTFRNNSAQSVVGGGVVYSDTDSAVHFERCSFWENYAIKGKGGVANLQTRTVSYEFRDCSFEGNTAHTGGGALSLTASHGTVISSNFTANQVAAGTAGGGAVELSQGARSLFAGCEFHNHRGDWGSVFQVAAAELSLQDSSVIENSAFHGCIYLTQHSNVSMKKVDMMNNTAVVHPSAFTSDGAAVYINTGLLNVVGCRFLFNYADSGAGGAVWVGTDAVLTALSTTFSNNRAVGGGAVEILGNRASLFDGCVLMRNSAAAGGAVHVNAKSSVNIKASIFSFNQAKEGSGGGLAADDYSLAHLHNVTFLQNEASDLGGGAFIGSHADVKISTSTSFLKNKAQEAGGGLFWVDARQTVTWVTNKNFALKYGADVATDIYAVQLASPKLTFRTGVKSDAAIQLQVVDFYQQTVKSTTLGNSVRCQLSTSASLVAGSAIEFSQAGEVAWDTAVFSGNAGSQYNLNFSCQWQRCVNDVIIATNSTVQATLSAVSCVRGEYLLRLSDHSRCAVCPAGSYALEPTEECNECPRGARCDGGDKMQPLAGWWKTNRNTSRVYGCPFPRACEGGEDSKCSPGHRGPLCGLCEEGYTRIPNGCARCAWSNMRLYAPVIVIAAILAVASIFIAFIQRPKHADIQDNTERSHVTDVLSVGIEMCAARVVGQSSEPSCKDLERKQSYPPISALIDSDSAYKTLSSATPPMVDYHDSTTDSSDLSLSDPIEEEARMTVPEGELDSNTIKTDEPVGENYDMKMKKPKKKKLAQFETKMQAKAPAEEAVTLDETRVGSDPQRRQFWGLIRIAVIHIQLLGVFYTTMPSIPWPPIMQTVSQMAAVLNLQISVIVPVGCFSSELQRIYPNFIFAVALPVVFLSAVGVAFCRTRWQQARYGNSSDESSLNSVTLDLRMKQIRNFYMQVFVGLLMVLYPFLVVQTLQIFNCILSDTGRVLAEDVQTPCMDETWWWHAYFAFASIIMYLIGIPVAVYLLLKRNRHKLWFSTDMFQRFWMLYEVYKTDAYYWEVIELFRRLMLAGPVLFLEPGSSVQIGGCMIIAYSFLLAHMRKQPFRDANVHHAYTQSSFSILFILMSALMLITYDCVDDLENEADTDQTWAHGMFGVFLWLSMGYAACVWGITMYRICSINHQSDGDLVETAPNRAEHIQQQIIAMKCGACSMSGGVSIYDSK